jgi:hypothetical protein
MCATKNREQHRIDEQMASGDIANEPPVTKHGAPRRQLCVNRFSEREAARELAAICQLLLQVLARDFDVNLPGCIIITPKKLGEVEVRTCDRP